MLTVLVCLFWGWVFSWFGFDSFVIRGMKELFDMTITGTGYYFLITMFGVAKSIMFSINGQKYFNIKED